MKKRHFTLRNLLIDAMAAGLALTVFALFHHVLPREQQSLNVQIVRPAASVETTAKAETETAAETTAKAETETAAETTAKAETETAAETETSDVKMPAKAATDSTEKPAEKAPAAAKTTDEKPEKTAGDTAGTAAKAVTENQTGKEPEAEDSAETDTAAAFRPIVRTTASAGTSDSVSQSGRTGKQSRQKGGSGKNGMNSKGGSALTESAETSSEAAETESSVSLAEKFSDKFTDTVVVTENSYTSPDLAITVTEVNEGNLTYYIADCYVRDITCFQTALASDTYGSGFRDSIERMAVLNNALLAVNGDYYGNTTEGVVIRNGVIYRANPTNCDVCVLYYDGTMKVMPGSSFTVEDAVADGAWQAWTFGPALLDTDGSVLTAFSSTNRIISANPRTAIGYYEPGHYCLVVVDGRGESSGMTLSQMSRLFHDLGCSAAYNLDGGNSSIMVWGSEVINNPSGGGRESSDALLLAEVRAYE